MKIMFCFWLMYKIIRFNSRSQSYYPKSIESSRWENDSKYIDHTQVDSPLGFSRIGGPLIDLPNDFELPDGMNFVAQLNLSDFSPLDPFHLLPKSGFLYFFIGGYDEEGVVHYADVEARELKRIVKEHDGWFYKGCQIEEIFVEEEDIESRFYEPEDNGEEWGYKQAYVLTIGHEPDEGPQWDYFAGTEKSKIYGIYTHCQKYEDEIRAISSDPDKILLLQIGENYTGDGVWSVLINKDDIGKRRFDHCQFEWGQS